MPSDEMILNDAATTATAHSAVWRPSAEPRHRAARDYRKAVTVALWAALAVALAVVALSVHRYGYGSALNGGYFWHTPLTPENWTFGYEVYGTPGWFTGSN